MRISYITFLLISILIVAFIPSCILGKQKEYYSPIVINEIAWMGTKYNYREEWIELYNNTDKNIDLRGWSIIDQSGKLKIPLYGTIPSHSYFLLKRNSKNTSLGIKVDLLYSGTLKNSGAHLQLIDNLGNVFDEVDCSNGWFAGDNKTKRTMERINSYKNGSDPTNWQTSILSGGTPKNPNKIISKSKFLKSDIPYYEPSSSSFFTTFLFGFSISLVLTFLAFNNKLK